jgi:hypothetical protein
MAHAGYMLSSESSHLKLEVAKFLSTVRAALAKRRLTSVLNHLGLPAHHC